MDNRQQNNIPYSYTNAGFNGFMQRSIDSRPSFTLRDAAKEFRQMNNQTINFDNTATTGSLGDSIQVGDIVIDGANRRISIFDDGRANEVGRIGNLDG